MIKGLVYIWMSNKQQNFKLLALYFLFLSMIFMDLFILFTIYIILNHSATLLAFLIKTK